MLNVLEVESLCLIENQEFNAREKIEVNFV